MRPAHRACHVHQSIFASRNSTSMSCTPLFGTIYLGGSARFSCMYARHEDHARHASLHALCRSSATGIMRGVGWHIIDINTNMYT